MITLLIWSISLERSRLTPVFTDAWDADAKLSQKKAVSFRHKTIMNTRLLKAPRKMPRRLAFGPKY
jgi:hypothetical protein